jgi:ATP-dependent DNA helicase RecG
VVKKALGTGHKESVYQKALAIELLKQGVSFQREKQLPVMYDDTRVGYYQPDLIIDDKVIIELKALPRISEQNQRQTWDYLRGTDYKLALLINFGSSELTIKRIVCDKIRSFPRPSASVPRESAQQMPLPHLLSMTATPIPRTLALTIYGDLDITLLDEMPEGRKPVVTKIIGPGQQKPMYEHVRSELKSGRQVYVICPRIDEPDPEKQTALNVKSVKSEAERLATGEFSEYSVGILHGKMTPVEKDKVMLQFTNHEIDVLVATSVVEVGVSVANATNIIIEGAERFGLSQLHQLRGRVIRSNHQPYCFAVTESKSEKTRDRLKALATAKNGFELAEYDLEFRGGGELYGAKQSGLTDLGMEAIKNLKLVEAARNEARDIVANHPHLSKDFPLIAKKVAKTGEVLHME